MAVAWKKTAPKVWSKGIQQAANSANGTGNGRKSSVTSKAKAQFRNKFLDGLKFYCESPSLILNSDLPADLVEFVTSQGFPIEALGIILELKKAGSITYPTSFPNLDTTSATGTESKSVSAAANLQYNEISRRLVEHWMTSDSCAEAFVSLSIGEEIPGIIAETSNFHRILFAVVDHFHLNWQSFLRFLLDQSLLSIAALVYGIRENASAEEAIKIRSQPLSSFIDRIYLRFHSDVDHFQPDLIKSGKSSNPFVEFFSSLSTFCEEDYIGRRLTAKILLGLGNNSAIKVAKTVFLVEHNPGSHSPPASKFFLPAEDFLQNNPIWKHVLLTKIPFKTTTKSKSFWFNWAHFIFSHANQISNLPSEIWSNCVSNWSSLCAHQNVESSALVPATFALIALAREMKSRNETNIDDHIPPAVTEILEVVTKCLDSTNEEKRACGMAVGQIISFLHLPKDPENDQKLKFESKNKVFLELIKFYNESQENIEATNFVTQKLETLEINDTQLKTLRILDSDDDEEEQEELRSAVDIDDDVDELEQCSNSNDFPIDERLLSLRLQKRKIPMYFSEIVEALMGSGTSKDEDEGQIALKEVSILKIPVLLSLGVKIDSNMAKLITRYLHDMDGDGILNVPIICSLYELSTIHPFDVFDTLANAVFDKDHHTIGHRMLVLSRYVEIVELISRQKCFSCFSPSLKGYELDICKLYPDFLKKYYATKTNQRICRSCTQRLPKVEAKVIADEENSAQPSASSGDSEMQLLTWREIIDRRVAAKTKHFCTPKKTPIVIPDVYSSKLVPIIWASVANRLSSRSDFFMNTNDKSGGALNDMLLSHVFRVLGRIVMGTAGPNCPHLKNIAAQVGELVSTFISHRDPLVRRSVLVLLAITVTTAEGKTFVIEALSTQEAIFDKLNCLSRLERDGENQALFTNVLAYMTTAAVADIGSKLSQ